MTTLGDEQAVRNRALAEGASRYTRGTCESIDWAEGLATINVGGGSIPMPMVGTPPYVGGDVWVAYLGTLPLCVGPVAKAAVGTTTDTAAGGKIDVLGDDGVAYNFGYLGDAPASAVRVLLDHSIGGTVLGTLSAEPTTVTPDTPTAPSTVIKTFTFYPTDSGNWTGSGYNSIPDPYCSASNDGAYFYGNTIPDTIPDDAVFQSGSLQVFLAEFYNQYPSSLATLGLHNLAVKSGAPNPSQTIALPNLYPAGGWVTLPDSWEDELRLGTARGIAFNQGGYHKYRRAGVDNSGVIVGKWSVNGA